MFATESKRPLPSFPRRIGLITSLQAAALRDVLTTLRRRAPQVEVVLYPTPVQGEGVGAQIATAVRTASERNECDLLILCRGGGSLEDLWAFNDETLARAIRASCLPVITGIGHETDFCIADFAADRRAATPTAAAELAAPQRAALMSSLADLRQTLRRQIRQRLDRRHQQLDLLDHRLQHPAQALLRQRERLFNLQRRLDSGLAQSGARGRHALATLTRRLLLARPETGRHARRLETLTQKLHSEWNKKLEARSSDLSRLAASLHHLNPQAVLARGFSIVTDEQGRIVRDSRALEPNDRIAVSFGSGRANATVNSLRHAVSSDPASPNAE